MKKQVFLVAVLLMFAAAVNMPVHAASEDTPSRGEQGIPDKLSAEGQPVTAPTLTSERRHAEPFGANLFDGNFSKTRGDGLNPNYIISPGDQVAVAVWGAVSMQEVYTVDSQGNIFMPGIGPLRLEGVRNSSLTRTVKAHIGNVYSEFFDVYTNLVTAQPVAIYVTGMVNNPGRYGGLPSDSILYFLDLAEGIDPRLGSFRNIEVIRSGKSIADIDLYDFILHGKMKSLQLRENDTILVRHRGPVVQLDGNVGRSALIELKSETATGAAILKVVPKAAQATEVTLVGMRNSVPVKETMSVKRFLGHELRDGDMVTLRDDGRSDAILVHLEGEFEGPAMLSVKRGSRLLDVLNHVPINPDLANTTSIHLRRSSVAIAQKDAINDSLFRLERSSLLALSSSIGQAEIRVREAELMEMFIEKAKRIDPLGRVVTSQEGIQQNILLESGDTIVIPLNTRIVRVAGEVMIMHALTHREGWTAEQYIQQAGGYSDRADQSNVIIHHPNAEVAIVNPREAQVSPGDEILVPPRVDRKIMQYAMDFMDVIYKVAISAAVALDL